MIYLEQTIADLIRRKYAAPEGSAERRLIERQLTGSRYTYEEAGPIMEDIDPTEWGGPARPLARTLPEQPQVLPLHRA